MTLRIVAGDQSLQLEFVQNLAAEDAVVAVEVSRDLVDWSAVEIRATATLNGDGTVTRRANLPAGYRFARLAIRLRRP